MARGRKAGQGYGPRGTSYTEMKAKDFAKMIKDDLGEEVDAQLNGFIRAVVNDLSTDSKKRGFSPVLTGFFASSWKASTNRINQKDERHREPEWARIKYGGKPARLLPGYKPLIKQRWTVPNNFKRNQSIFIGNTAKYTPYAFFSEKSRIAEYLNDTVTLKTKIDRFFTDKRPDIRVAGGNQQIGKTNYYRTKYERS